jgi:hypothetical protein
MTSRALLIVVSAALLQAACGGSSTPGPATVVTGTPFGQPFTVHDALLVHPQQWKSAAAGSTAILVSDTPDLCAQITSGKTTAPGRLLILRLEQRDAGGAITAITPGTFVDQGEGAASRFGQVYGDAVDAACAFAKLSTDQVQIDVTSVGSGGAPLTGTFGARDTSSGGSIGGSFSVSSGCDETAVDAYLNRNPTCL